jgi:hypothetical protein
MGVSLGIRMKIWSQHPVRAGAELKARFKINDLR